MQCPKCKKITDDNASRCIHCGAKVNVACPACRTLNPLGTKECKNCGFELLKYCPKCNAANLPSSKQCRKCGADLNVARTSIISKNKTAALKLSAIKRKDSPINKLAAIVVEPVAKNPELFNEPQNQESTLFTTPVTVENEVKEENTSSPDVNVLMEKIAEAVQEDMTKTEPEEQIEEQEEQKEQEEELQTSDEEEVTAEDTVSEEENEEIEEEETESESEAEDETEAESEEAEEVEVEEEISEEEKEEENGEDDENILDEDEEVVQEDNVEEEDFDIYFQSQQNAKNTISDLLTNSQKYIVGLSGAQGTGKTYVLREVFNQLQSPDILWLWAECTPLTQVSAMGAIRDMLVNFFNISLICQNILNFKSDSKKFFAQEFPDLNREEVDLLINFLYPHKTSFYETINENRESTFELLEKLFFLIGERGRVFFIIDDFELIDGCSYDFICRLIEKGAVNNNFKLVITYGDTREIEGFISSSILSPKTFESVHLGDMSKEELDTMIYSFLKTKDVLPESILEEIKQNADGSPAYAESAISYLSEINAIEFGEEETTFNPDFTDIEIPKTTSSLIWAKLEQFKQNNQNAYKLLMNAAILGNKFSIELLNLVCELDLLTFEDTVKLLIGWGYFMQLNPDTFAFKNNLLWRECYEYAKNDIEYEEYNRKLLDTVSCNIVTNNSLKALLAQNINSAELCFEYWTQNTKLAAFIGDISLYVISQKQSLKYLEECKKDNEQLIKNNIYERIGKLLAQTAPAQALEFLSNAVIMAENSGNPVKIIDIATYLGIAAKRLDNYLGVIEVVNLVLKYIKKEENPLGWALVNQKKLEAVLTLGNCAELIDIAENDIIPVLRNYVYSSKSNFVLDSDLIYEGWIETNIILAQAYIMQGSNKAATILCSLDDMLEAHKIDNSYYKIYIDLMLALNYTLNGQIKKSADALRNISGQNYGMEFDEKLHSKWNFINALNKFILKQYDKLKPELFEIVAFANNCGDAFTKNILKLILGRMLQAEGDVGKASRIYNEQVTWFAKSKVAIGAMLGWYFITDATLQTEGAPEALEIAQKALDVAKNPKIQNYFFMILYKMQIAQIYLKKGDFDAAKMYIEKALLISKKGDLYSLKAQLHLMYGQYFEEVIKTHRGKAEELNPRIKKNYETALALARKIESATLIKTAQAAVSKYSEFSAGSSK